MEVLVYRAGNDSTTNQRQVLVSLNWARQAGTKWSDADCQMATVQLECKIYQGTPVKWKLVNKLSQHHEQQLFQEVETKATGPWRIFAKTLAQIKTAAAEEAHGVAHMTPDKQVQFQIDLSIVETEAETLGLVDMEHVTDQLSREIYNITWNMQKWFNKELSVRLVMFDAWWETVNFRELQNIKKYCIMHFGYPKMHLVSHILESIQWMEAGQNVTTDISEQHHVANIQRTYWSSKKVNYVSQTVEYIEMFTGLGNME